MVSAIVAVNCVIVMKSFVVYYTKVYTLWIYTICGQLVRCFQYYMQPYSDSQTPGPHVEGTKHHGSGSLGSVR